MPMLRSYRLESAAARKCDFLHSIICCPMRITAVKGTENKDQEKWHPDQVCGTQKVSYAKTCRRKDLMKRTKFQRLAALILALIFIMGGAISASAADAVLSSGSSVTDSSISDIQEQLSAISYEEYSAKYEHVPGASSEIVIDATQYDKTLTTAEVKVDTFDGVEALYTPSMGTTVWKVNVPAEAKYSMLIEYYPVEGKAASIERVFRLNGEIPFAEARYLTLAKIYANTYPDGEILLKNGESADTYISAAAAAGITATTETREKGTYVVFQMPEYWTSENSAFVDENIIRFFTP